MTGCAALGLSLVALAVSGTTVSVILSLVALSISLATIVLQDRRLRRERSQLGISFSGNVVRKPRYGVRVHQPGMAVWGDWRRDMEALKRAGLPESDARTSLSAFYRQLEDLSGQGRGLRDFQGDSDEAILRQFGSDAGRAALVLIRGLES